MKQFSLFLIFSVVIVTAMPRANGQAVENPVLAVINDTVITQNDVMKLAQPRIDQIDPDLSYQEAKEIKSSIMLESLRTLIEDKLLQAKAKSILKEHPDLEKELKELVDKQVETERRKAGGEIKLRELLREEGTSYANYVEDIKNRLLYEMLMYRFVLSGISVTRDEVLDYYEAHRDSLKTPMKVKYRRLFIKRKQHYGGSEEARTLAEDLAKRLREGADFAELTREYSDGPHAADGGFWDFEEEGIRPEPVNEILTNTPIGEIGGPAETNGDFTIVQIIDRTPGKTLSFEEAQYDIREQLERTKRSVRYADFIRRLENENFVEIRGMN